MDMLGVFKDGKDALFTSTPSLLLRKAGLWGQGWKQVWKQEKGFPVGRGKACQQHSHAHLSSFTLWQSPYVSQQEYLHSSRWQEIMK